MRTLRPALPKLRVVALSALFVGAIALGLSACGGSLPGNSVAKIDQQSIKRDTFDHWMRVIAISAAAQQNPTAATTAPNAQPPDPPEFTQCVAAKRKTTPKPAKGQPETTDAQLKQQCKTEYGQYRDQVLSFLIRSTWLEQEAAKQGIKVTDKEAQKQLSDARKQAQLDKNDAWQRFLVRSGLTVSDILFQQRSSLLEQKVTDKITKSTGKVTDAQIQAYYDSHKQSFAQPERRDIRVVLTKTEDAANTAKSALDSGESWTAVAKQYSTDASTKNQGGKLAGVAKGQQEKALDDAVFAAQQGTIGGPVKTQFGWYVFEVTKITPGSQQSLADSKETIRQQISQQRSQKAISAFGTAYRNRWKAATECRKDFVIDDCGNAPKKKANATTTGGTTTVPPGAQTTPGQ